MTFEQKLIDFFKKHDIELLLTNPCIYLRHFFYLIEREASFDIISLPREEHGVGISAGAFLAGKRSAMIIQSTGLGNILNSLASLTQMYEFPLIIVCSWRGGDSEPIKTQKLFGRAVPGLLEALKLSYDVIENETEWNLIEKKWSNTYQNNEIRVLLVKPQVWNQDIHNQEKFISNQSSFLARDQYLKQKLETSHIKKPELSRYQALEIILDKLDDEECVIVNLGFPSREVYAIRDRPLNFYMLGSLGQVSSIGLAVARYSSRKVTVLDGDGSILFSLGIFALLKHYRTPNLRILCLNNETYGSTGDQVTLASKINLELVAKSFGLRSITVTKKKEIIDSLNQNWDFVNLRIKPGNASVQVIPTSPLEIRNRFILNMQF